MFLPQSPADNFQSQLKGLAQQTNALQIVKSSINQYFSCEKCCFVPRKSTSGKPLLGKYVTAKKVLPRI